MITIKRRWIEVIDDRYHPLQEVRLTVNEREFDGPSLDIPDEEAEGGIMVTATKPGYEPASKTFSNIERGMRIVMHSQTISHVYRIKAFDAYGNPIDDMVATIETSAPMGVRPIRGYHLQAKTEMEAIKRLHFDKPKPKGKMYTLFFALGFLTMGLIWGMVTLIQNYEIGWRGPFPTFKQKVIYAGSRVVHLEDVTDAPEEIDLADANGSYIKDALDYLNAADVWEKSKMAEYYYLDGLYDAMNEFQLDTLKMVWQSRLANCPKFNDIMTHVERNLRNHWKPAEGRTGGRFDSSSKGQISVDDYVQWLNEDHRR